MLLAGIVVCLVNRPKKRPAEFRGRREISPHLHTIAIERHVRRAILFNWEWIAVPCSHGNDGKWGKGGRGERKWSDGPSSGRGCRWSPGCISLSTRCGCQRPRQTFHPRNVERERTGVCVCVCVYLRLNVIIRCDLCLVNIISCCVETTPYLWAKCSRSRRYRYLVHEESATKTYCSRARARRFLGIPFASRGRVCGILSGRDNCTEPVAQLPSFPVRVVPRTSPVATLFLSTLRGVSGNE